LSTLHVTSFIFHTVHHLHHYKLQGTACATRMGQLKRVYGKQCLESSKKCNRLCFESCSGADKSLARPGRKQATATEDFYVHVPYLRGLEL